MMKKPFGGRIPPPLDWIGLTSVAAVHESQRQKPVDERDEEFYADLVATR